MLPCFLYCINYCNVHACFLDFSVTNILANGWLVSFLNRTQPCNSHACFLLYVVVSILSVFSWIFLPSYLLHTLFDLFTNCKHSRNFVLLSFLDLAFFLSCSQTCSNCTYVYWIIRTMFARFGGHKN